MRILQTRSTIWKCSWDYVDHQATYSWDPETSLEEWDVQLPEICSWCRFQKDCEGFALAALEIQLQNTH